MALRTPRWTRQRLMDDISIDAVEAAALDSAARRRLEMTKLFDLVIRGGTVVNHAGEGPGDYRRQGRPHRHHRRISTTASAGEVFDATGLHVLPGVIDTQVHFREPGNEHKEDLETGTRAAALGGVTAVFEMPNTAPPTTTVDALARQARTRQGPRARRSRLLCRAPRTRTPISWARLERTPGCCGVKTFMGSSTGTLLVGDDEGLDRVVKNINRRGAFHAEDEDRLNERKKLAREGDWTSHPEVRDDQDGAARHLSAWSTRRASTASACTCCTCRPSDEMAFLATAKDVATVETLPQFLTFKAPEVYERLKGFAQMNPPIRYADGPARALVARHRRQGVVDVLGTDHAPHTREEKAQPYPKSPSGMPGVQTLVPVMLTHVNEGRLTLQRFVDLTSHGPQPRLRHRQQRPHRAGLRRGFHASSI